MDLDAPIIPGVSLGGYNVGTRLLDIRQDVSRLGQGEEGEISMVGPFQARYALGKGEVKFDVDVRVGKIYQVIAGRGYLGTYEGKLRVGMPIREAIKVVPELEIDYFLPGFTLKSAPGILIEVNDPDPELSFAIDMDVHAISVAFPDEAKLQRGEW
jgi:hypothetical protein